MKLVPAKQAQAAFMNAPGASSTSGGKGLALYTFKKDRWVRLEPTADGWVLDEHGFVNVRTPLPPGRDTKRLLKEAFAREFPPSNKIYVEERG